VKFLVDEALQDLVADRLIAAGHDATHVRALGMQGAIDDDVLAHAADEQRVLVTTDTDFRRPPRTVRRARPQLAASRRRRHH
jgi:predicted nuclease of predicted toxin-antitoxin system